MSVCNDFCSESHNTYACLQFQNISASDRTKFARSKQLCFNCLQKRHSVSACGSKYTCRESKMKHQTFQCCIENLQAESSNKRPFRLMHLIKSEDITQTVVLRSHCEASHEHQQHYSSLTISSFSNVSLSTAYVQLLEKNWQRNGVACTSWLRLSSQFYDKG